MQRRMMIPASTLVFAALQWRDAGPSLYLQPYTESALSIKTEENDNQNYLLMIRSNVSFVKEQVWDPE